MRSSVRLFSFCIALVPLFALVAWLAYWPPASAPGEQPATVASSVRARAIIERVFAGLPPHPAGSEANRVVRERLIAEMRGIGLDPVEQRGFSCAASGGCADVVNVLARIEGSEDGALLLMAHYDSVPAGPGIGDDASGTAAVLETARAILARGTPERDIIVLVTDGEELGLLGARLFAAEHPWSSDVRWIVNSEARGTTGPMLMFETSGENLALVRSVARSNPGLVTNSLLYTIYRKLPNDTDLTVLRDGVRQGVNFAMIGGASRYHTPLDDLAHLDPRSLDHATRMVDAAAQRILRDTPERARGDATFFDVYGWFVVSWPAAWSFAIALVTAAVFIVAVAMAARSRGLGRSLSSAAGRSGPVVGLAALLLYGCHLLLRHLGATRASWPAEPHWIFLAFAATVPLLMAIAHRMTWKLDRFALWVAISAPGVLLAVAVSWLLPGASFILVVPAIAAAAGAVIETRRRDGLSALAILLPLIGSLFVMSILLWQFYLALGGAIVPLMAGLLFLSLLGAIPALPQARLRVRYVVSGSLLLLCAGVVLAAVRPQWSVDTPQPLSIQLVNVDGQAHWVLPRSAPAAMVESGELGPEPVAVYPFDPDSKFLVAPADSGLAPLPGVSWDARVTRDGSRVVEVRITPAKSGAHHGLWIPAERVKQVEINGRVLRPEDRRFNSRLWSIRNQTSGSGGMQLTVTLEGEDPLELWVYERSYEFPEEGAALVAARPPWAVPIQEPDRTVAVRTVQVDPHEASPSATIDSNGT